jgi:putative GTP pyrophosphokinase
LEGGRKVDLEEEIPNKAEMLSWYEAERPHFERLLAFLTEDLRSALEREGLCPTLKTRVKSFESLFAKTIKTFVANKTAKRGQRLLITDILGIRVICPFIEDIQTSERCIAKAFDITEREKKGSERTFREFGYESLHLLASIPERHGALAQGLAHKVCEIQIRTLLQDAWAEVEHELVYKNEFNPLDEQMKRKLAALNANLSLSDVIFQELRNYQKDLGRELRQRRETFYATIENAIDSPFYDESADQSALKSEAQDGSISLSAHKSIDDLLVMALNAHNAKNYAKAIEIYGVILRMHPRKDIVAVIRKHRGMAYFSQSMYQEAIEDFRETLEQDPKCYKAAYYKGVVNSVLEKYEEALVDYDAALAINPCHFYSLYRRGQTWFHLGDFPKALADAEAALGIEPTNDAARNLKMLVMKKLAM